MARMQMGPEMIIEETLRSSLKDAGDKEVDGGGSQAMSADFIAASFQEYVFTNPIHD